MSIDDKLKPQFKRLAALEMKRAKDDTDEKIARDMGDCYGDPKIMYGRLAAEGTPICTECGETWPSLDHACQKAAPPKKASKIKGEIEELPPTERAVPFFEDALARLRLLAARLPQRREYRKGSRFVAAESGESIRTYTRLMRREMEPDEWREVCKKHGLDPDAAFPEMESGEWREVCEEYGLNPDVAFQEVPYRSEAGSLDAPFGIPNDHPPEPLPALVGTFALAGWDMDELVEVLHPAPDRADHQQIEKVRQNLLRQARRLASLVRGGKAGPGQRGPESPANERLLAAHVRELQDRGWTDEMIVARLRGGGYRPLPPGFEATVSEVRRLADLA